MTTLEEMAIAVLKGDIAAARALADSLREEHSTGMMELPPVHKIKYDVDKVRVVAFVPMDVDIVINHTEIQRAVRDWISGKDTVLTLLGVSRIELYEIPRGKDGP